MQILIHTNGTLLSLYDETIDLTQFGQLVIRRASHVEPNELGQWFADMRPVCGPTLGPFEHRSLALQAEQRWLETNLLNGPNN